MRPTSITPMVGATAESRFPATNRPMRIISIVLRPIRVPSTVISGAPMTTPIA